jgi:hypothetical protein
MKDFIAILDRSAGNETVGDMWQETAVFDGDTPIKDVVIWALQRMQRVNGEPHDCPLTARLQIATAQYPKKGE